MAHVAAHRRLLIAAAFAVVPLLLGTAGQRQEDSGRSLNACVEACVRAGTPREACLDRCRCFEKCMAGGGSTASCRPVCGMGTGTPASTDADPRAPGRGLLSGTYKCDTCPRSQSWRINNRLLYWEGTPYIPVGAFSENPYHPRAITDFSISVDGDFSDVGQTEAQYFDRLDRLTSRISAEGKTYVMLVSYPQPPRVADWMADEREIERMAAAWRRYAGRVRKAGLRGIWLFGEINWEWRWPAGRSPAQYGALLRRLADQAQQIFGEVPILFKTAAAGGGFANVMAGAALASGLGFDVYPKSCSARGFDPETAAELQTLRQLMPESLGLLWAAEFGKRSPKTEEELQKLPLLAGYIPFERKSELRCYLDGLVAEGMTGFIYAPRVTKTNYDWYAELKPSLLQQVRSRHEHPAPVR